MSDVLDASTKCHLCALVIVGSAPTVQSPISLDVANDSLTLLLLLPRLQMSQQSFLESLVTSIVLPKL